jgi:pimeloyl-ACP methyl ester carboxylesterase
MPAEALPQLPTGRPLEIRGTDGVRLHAEVFGPRDGQPIVLAHGITCALEVWAHQIADLAADYRVIAYDHRGHGRSETPRGAPRLQPQPPGGRSGRGAGRHADAGGASRGCAIVRLRSH